MPDTIRDRTALLVLLADNTTGQISPQDLRDVLVSVFGVYGAIYTDGGAIAQTVNIAAARLDLFAENGSAAGMTPVHSNDNIRVDSAGVYRVSCQLSFTGTAERTIRAQLRNGATPVNGASARRKLNAAGDLESLSFEALVTCAANDLLSVYVDADVDGTSMTLVDGQLVAQRVA